MTVRLGDQRSKYSLGDKVVLTLGWTEKDATSELKPIEITKIIFLKICNINPEDLIGESPDCTKKDAIPFVLSAIYRKIVTDQDYVTLIEWKYL